MSETAIATPEAPAVEAPAAPANPVEAAVEFLNQTKNTEVEPAQTESTEVETANPDTTEVKEETAEETTEEKPEESKKDSLSKSWVKLQQKEQALIEKANEIKQLEGEVSQYKAALQNATNDPISFLKASGITLDMLTERLIDGPKEEDPRDAKLRELEEFKKQSELRMQQQQQEKMVNDYRQGLEDHLKTESAQYPLLISQNATDTVWDVIIESAKAGNVLGYKDACDMVENHFQTMKIRLLGDTKPSVKSTPPPVSTLPAERTLSNNTEAAVPALDRPMTAEERMEAAVKFLQQMKQG